MHDRCVNHTYHIVSKFQQIWTSGPRVEITSDPVDDEDLTVDVDAPVCSSWRSFVSMRGIFASVLLHNEA